MLGQDEGLGDRNRLRGQAQNDRWARFAQTGNMRDLDGGFMDPGFDAMFQSWGNQGVSGVRDDLSPRNIYAASNTVQQPGMESNQIGRAGIGGALAQKVPASLVGIQHATKRRS
jgi:hypothetical protein